MSLIDSVLSLATDVLTVTRRAPGSHTDGIYTRGAPTTFTITASIQPATGMQRVVGGRDQRFDRAGVFVTDVQEIYTMVELKTADPDGEADEITYRGAQWIVLRAERWDLSSQVYWRVLVTKLVGGAA